METHYFAITKYGTTKEAPFAVARLKDGVFEVFRNGKWEIDGSLADMFVGELTDYETITEEEANRIINA
ncbi:hypothetical protein [Caldibacillus debilis]|uniref:hypothetical protein n=1 Tax=Caldibacillus debilis TaxID=301148 RepID=UPI000E380E34|nr:hypothetical protein [Caldibacillus debilis]REJ27142.1 MAG: hypothetical protein C6W56_11115 [Caldibacillus debilis]